MESASWVLLSFGCGVILAIIMIKSSGNS